MFNDFLKRYGLKVTKGRIAILEVLTKANKSMGADAIFEECKNNGVDINLSTVYRALELFEEKEIIDKFALKEGICSYRLKGEEHKHLLKCTICNKEVQVPCPMRQIEEIVQSETGFTLTKHNLVMTGICEECSKHEKKE
ncbi:Fur family transcriptional regulator [Clostridium sp. SHJSY1]|uniref:Fur family transcriptional regulator n=1 Tax=Clostridium sp. SHJSY1 TaxID=2942483 RepID=UPI0037BF41CE